MGGLTKVFRTFIDTTKGRYEEDQKLLLDAFETLISDLIDFDEENGVLETKKELELNNFEIENYISEIVENLDNHSRNRKKGIQILILFGERNEKQWPIIANRQVLTKWIYHDLQLEDNDELLYLALRFLANLCSQPLPPSEKSKLGYSLVDLLLEMMLDKDDDGEENELSKLISRQCLLCIMNINNQFDTISLDENRVLAKLFEHPAQGAIGQKFINFLNRADNDSDLFLITKLIGDIFRNAALSESFFYRNDFNVLLEVIIRELGNRTVDNNDISRQLLLSLLDPTLRKSDYREHCHYFDQVYKQISELTDYRDPVVAKMASNLLVHLKEIRKWKK